MRKGLLKSKKGLSTVIATIIIVAIAIVMSIAVAYWAMGIGGSFTRFEKLQYASAYATDNATIVMNVKNTGTAAATVSTILVNGRPLAGTADKFLGKQLNPGDNINGTINFNPSLQHGASVEVQFQTAAGNLYPDVVVMP